MKVKLLLTTVLIMALTLVIGGSAKSNPSQVSIKDTPCGICV